MNKILCPVDDCEPTKVAARLAGTLAAATGADLTLLAVNEMIGGYMRRDASALLWSPSQLSALLDEAKAAATSTGAEKIETASIESRDVARAISQYAEQKDTTTSWSVRVERAPSSAWFWAPCRPTSSTARLVPLQWRARQQAPLGR